MTQWGKALDVRSGDPSSIPGHMEEGEAKLEWDTVSEKSGFSHRNGIFREG